MDLLDPVVLVDPVDPVHPLDPVDPVDLVDLLDALDPLDPLDLVDPVDLIAVDPVDIPKLKHSRCRSGMTFHSCSVHSEVPPPSTADVITHMWALLNILFVQ